MSDGGMSDDSTSDGGVSDDVASLTSPLQPRLFSDNSISNGSTSDGGVSQKQHQRRRREPHQHLFGLTSSATMA
jgi:hypothetical protein